MIDQLTCLWRRLRADRRGNVLMILGFALIPLTVSVGMGVDYARAARMQTRLNALADAAALQTVTTPMMVQSASTAANNAFNSWTQQAAGTSGMVTPSPYNSVTCPAAAKPAPLGSVSTTKTDNSSLLIIVSDTILTGHARQTTVCWHAASTNAFGGILGLNQIELNGYATTSAKQAPNIDFYLLVDSSGSMAFPSTSTGITQLRSLTNGCAFACHATNDAKATARDGSQQDYYTVATSYGIPLRITEARNAVQSMMNTATTTEANNNAQYRAALASFAAISPQTNNTYKSLSSLTTNLSSVATAANGITTSLYYVNNCPTSSYCNSDSDTASSDAFTRMNTLMPIPGNGTNLPGDTPQEIMFIITDGMRDEYRANGRPEIAFDTTLCTAIKARGIRIGIIYTEYLQSSMDGDSWSQTNVVPYLTQVEPALQACASSGLYYKVTTDQDISAALNQLFQAAVATAHITQ